MHSLLGCKRNVDACREEKINMKQDTGQAEHQLTEAELQNVSGGTLGSSITRGLKAIVPVGSAGYVASKLGVKKAAVTITKGEKSATSDADIKKIVDDAIGPL